MKKRVVYHLLGFCLLFLLILNNSLFAQFGEGVTVLKSKAVYLEQSDSLQTQHSFSTFGNIGVTHYYENKKQLAQIEKAKDSLILHARLLNEYIQKFGILNFSRDNRFLWQMAHDFQALKDTGNAVKMYELAIKHSKGPRIPTPALDSLNMPTRCDWIPLEEYYKLLELRKRVDPLIPPKKVLQNMGKAINSEKADYAPYMHPSDSVLIFTSRRGKETLIDDIFTRENEDLYFAFRHHSTGKWEMAEKFSEVINTAAYNEGSACVTPNGETLYFTRCHAPDGVGDCDIYEAHWVNGRWDSVKRLSGAINTAEWDSQPNLSPDGNILFFSSNRKNGFGGTDIYYSTKMPNGEWNTAKNVGPVINTPENEITPFYHTINQTLYFGSTGQLKTYGLYDIFKSRWNGHEWEEPQSLGPLVNTAGSEYYFSIDGKGNHIYYAKAETSDKAQDKMDFDLFAFTMPMEARPDAVFKLKGFLLDSVTRKPLVGTVMLVDLDNGREIAPKKINDNGYFEFDLKNKNRYRIYVLGPNFLTVKKNIYLDQDSVFNLFTSCFDRKQPIVFESLEFPENSFDFASAAKPKLEYMARFMKNYPQYILAIKGHTDSDGNEDYNMKLSQKRAEKIKAYLLERSEIEAARVRAEGYGESRPIFPNDTEENKRKNRRVEFELIWNPAYEDSLTMNPTRDETTFDEEVIQSKEEEYYDPKEFLKEFEALPTDEDLDDINLFDDEDNSDDDLENELEEGDDMFEDVKKDDE